MIQINASLFVKAKGYTVANIPFDLVLSESHLLESELSMHPIEEGGSIGIHIHNKLRSGELEGLVSNWSVKAPLFVSEAWYNFVGLSAGTNRAVDFFQEVILKLWREKQLFDIVLGLDSYTNVFFTRVTANRDEDTGDAQSFKIAFREMPTVKLAKTKLTISVNPGEPITDVAKQASGTSDQGLQAGTVVP